MSTVSSMMKTDVRNIDIIGILKPARVETGAEIRVPLFIEEGETVEVDSRDGSYLGRVK